MKQPARANLILIFGTVLVINLLWAVLAAAAYDFELISERYVAVDTLWAATLLPMQIQNTGTEPDTIDLSITKDLPVGWGASLCIGGKCVGDFGQVYLGSGETEDLEILFFTAGQADMGLVHLHGEMRHAPAVIKSETYALFIGIPSLLLVDDDDGADYETYLEAALDSAGYKAHVWDADSLGRPSPLRLSSYWAVLWTTADGSASYITSSDEQNMMAYLDGGGNLFLTSMGFLTSRGAPTSFVTDYLHLESWADGVGGSVMTGVLGDPISDGMSLSLDPLVFPPAGVDTFASDTDLTYPMFTDQGGGKTGIRVEEGGHKAVFLAFPFETVPVSNADPDNQATLISRIIDWFDPPTAGVGELSPARPDGIRLMQNSPNPFAGWTQISFFAPLGTGHLDLEVYDVEGRRIRTLMSRPASGSRNTVIWDGTDDSGRPVAPGVYFYRLSIAGESIVKSMVLLK